MTHRIAHFVCIALAWMLLSPALAQQPTTYDCSRMYTTEAKRSYQLPAALIEYCIMRGWDPPGKQRPDAKNWQPAGGKPVRTGTAGSIQVGAKQPPAVPPGASSSSTTTGTTGNINFFGTYPGGSSSQCVQFQGQQVCPRCAMNPQGQNMCEIPVLDPATGELTYRPAAPIEESSLTPTNPVAGDLGGQLGPITRIRNGGRTPALSCGGTMNLSNSEVSTVLNATHLVVAKQQDRNVRVYARTGYNFSFIRNVKLGKKVCGVDDDDNTRPTNQFVFFNATQPKVALRAIQPTEEAQDQAGDDGGAVVYNTADEEKYVLLTPADLISGSTDRDGCEEFKRYPKTIPDLRIVPPQASDDVTMELPLNTDACIDRVLHLDLSTPNIVHQPGTALDLFTIAEHNEVASLTSDVSVLYHQPETFLRLAVPGAQFTFRSEVIMELPNLQTLHMYGPTTITGGQVPQFYLGGGGHIEDVDGEIVQRIAPASNYMPPGGITPPYYIISDEKVYMPAGLTLLNDRGGYIREPSNPPPPAEETPPTGP